MGIIYYDKDIYDEIIKEGFTILDFYGESCEPCKLLAETLDELIFELPFINVVKVDAKEHRDFAKEHKVMGVPAVFFIKDGSIVENKIGYMDIDTLKNIIKKYIY